jgi:hypothetical protein
MVCSYMKCFGIEPLEGFFFIILKNISGSIIAVNFLNGRICVDCLLTLLTSDLVSYAHILKEILHNIRQVNLYFILQETNIENFGLH